MVKGEKLSCTICGTEIEVPMCCDEHMKLVDDTLMCELCGSEEEVPVCCERKRVLVEPKTKKKEARS